VTQPRVPELIVFVGLPASGKTTYFRRTFADTHQHVSKDMMPRSANKDKRQRELIVEALASGRSVVVDNTNPTVASRAPLLEMARHHGARTVAIEFEAEVRECVAMNRLREGMAKVPNVAIFTAAKKFQKPSLDEGFDEVRVIRALPPARADGEE
jgi:predicted kinase